MVCVTYIPFQFRGKGRCNVLTLIIFIHTLLITSLSMTSFMLMSLIYDLCTWMLVEEESALSISSIIRCSCHVADIINYNENHFSSTNQFAYFLCSEFCSKSHVLGAVASLPPLSTALILQGCLVLSGLILCLL